MLTNCIDDNLLLIIMISFFFTISLQKSTTKMNLPNKKRTVVLTFVLISFIIFEVSAQQKTVKDSIKNWKTNAFFHLGANGTLYHNWTASGKNNMAIQALSKINKDYTKDKVKFNAELNLIYGMATDHGELLAKQSDLIQLESELNYQLKNNFHFTCFTHLTTQFSSGYIYTETSTDAEIKTKVSNFLSPGLSHEAIGIHLIGKKYQIGLAPLAMKQTIVIDNSISKSIYGLDNSENIKNEFGLYLNGNLNLSYFHNKLTIDSDLTIFSNYDNLGTTDLIFKNLIQYKVTKYFSINSCFIMIYDEDISRPNLIDSNGNGIPDTIGSSNSKIQIKEALTLGLSIAI